MISMPQNIFSIAVELTIWEIIVYYCKNISPIFPDFLLRLRSVEAALRGVNKH